MTLRDEFDAEWQVDRRLLADGCLRSVGEGNVRVSTFTEMVLIGFVSHDNRTGLLLNKSDLASFAGATYTLVPADRESDLLDIDSAIDAMLR